MYKVLCWLLSIILSVTATFGLNLRPDEVGKSVEVVSASSENISLENEFTLNFSRQKVNTAEIYFETEEVRSVSIFNGEKRIYYRTGSEDYRFCAFDTVETDSLRFVIDGKAASVKVSCKTASDRDFRIVTYIVASNIKDENSFNPEHFDVITDAIIFGCVTFGENGKVSVNTPLLENTLTSLRKAIGDRKVNIYFNILGPGADSGISVWEEQMESMSKKHSKAFLKPELIRGIKDLVNKYDFDGVFFDYEYPLENKYWTDFKLFLQRLDISLGTHKKIGVTTVDWNLPAAENITAYADMVELMQYDRFNYNGEHAPFSTCVSGYNGAESLYLKRDKLDMGVPFYGRPKNGGGLWPGYASNAAKLENGSDGAMTSDCGYCFFNSPQTIYDKTAYSLSKGLGGMMVWHYSCDVKDMNSEYSLFGAMKRCLDDRNIGAEESRGIC